LGRRLPGAEATLRQMSGTIDVAGATNRTGLGTTANDTVRTKVDADGAASSVSDAAQHWSASAWLTARAELESSESRSCIGQGQPSEQQAMRASGVATQPAHTATWPAARAMVNMSADKRLLRVSTSLECWSEADVSTEVLGAVGSCPTLP
jgi:hypothetical protein